MTGGDRARTQLPATLRSAGDARHLVRRFLEDRRCEALADDAELLVTELVTNAVIHARSAVDVAVYLRGGRVRVEVADTSRLPPRPREPAVDAVTGRGLLLVGTLSVAWGSDEHADGKTVWFELAGRGAEGGRDDAAGPRGQR